MIEVLVMIIFINGIVIGITLTVGAGLEQVSKAREYKFLFLE